MSQVNLRKYKLPSAMTDAEAYSILTENAANCPQVKTIAARAEDNEPVLNGSWYKYLVEVNNDHVHIKPKLDTSRQMILTMICLPFALWFVWGVQATGSDFFRAAALPVASMFISFGIIFLIAYILGDKEQKSVLPFIYSTLNRESAEKGSVSGKTGMSASYFSVIAALIIGIVILILHFVM